MPITPRSYENRPYVRPAYEPDTRTLLQLMAMAGQSRARAEGQKGQINAQGLMRLGDILSQGLGSIRQDSERKQAAAFEARKYEDEQQRKQFGDRLNLAQFEALQEEREANRQAREEAAKVAQEATAYKRGGEIAEEVGYGPMAEAQVDPVMQGPAAGRVRYSFGPGTAEGPELQPTRQQQRGIETERAIQGMGGQIGPNGQVVMPPKPERPPQPTTASLAERAAAGDKNAARALEILQRSRGTSAPAVPQTIDAPDDPDSQDIMGQAGLSYQGFLAATGDMSKLSRDKETRNRATAEVQAWARSRGIDVSTLQSQFKAYNDTLKSNIERYNRTVLAEGEIAADVENLLTSVTKSKLGDAKAINAAKQWLKGELNDPNAAEYAFYLNQLTNDIALYNAASQGRAALQSDMEEAKSVVQRGIATGSLTGLQTAITNSVEKMGVVLEGAVNRSRKNVWDLFGVGDKFKPVTRKGGGKQPDTAQPGDIEYDMNGNPIKKGGS